MACSDRDDQAEKKIRLKKPPVFGTGGFFEHVFIRDGAGFLKRPAIPGKN